MDKGAITRAREKAEAGKRLSLTDALALYEDNDLLFLASCARKMKERKSGKNVFYKMKKTASTGCRDLRVPPVCFSM